MYALKSIFVNLDKQRHPFIQILRIAKRWRVDSRSLYVTSHVTNQLRRRCWNKQLCQLRLQPDHRVTLEVGSQTGGCPVCLDAKALAFQYYSPAASLPLLDPSTLHSLVNVIPASYRLLEKYDARNQSCYAPSHLLSSGQASDLAHSLLWSSCPAWFQSTIPCFIISAYLLIPRS